MQSNVNSAATELWVPARVETVIRVSQYNVARAL